MFYYVEYTQENVTKYKNILELDNADAQRWLYRYETLTNYLGFKDKEKVEELCAVLLGHALSWFNGIPKSTLGSWDLVKQDFLHQYGGGANPTLAAMDELKKLNLFQYQ
ncbi:unnamed protein product [Mucor hiemalis]